MATDGYKKRNTEDLDKIQWGMNKYQGKLRMIKIKKKITLSNTNTENNRQTGSNSDIFSMHWVWVYSI